MTPQPLPPVDLDEIERLLSEATAGPFTLRHGAITSFVTVEDRSAFAEFHTYILAEVTQADKERKANAELFVALVNSAPGLIARIRELEGAVDDYAGAVNFAVDELSHEADVFLRAWREGSAKDEWPEYAHWRSVQALTGAPE